MSAGSYDAAELIKYGVILAKQHRYDDANKVFTRAIQMDNKIEQAYYLRGHARVKLKQLDGAMRDFKRTISLNRENDEAYYFLGVLLTKVNDWKKALWCFEEAIKLGNVEAVTQAERIQQRVAVPTSTAAGQKPAPTPRPLSPEQTETPLAQNGDSPQWVGHGTPFVSAAKPATQTSAPPSKTSDLIDTAADILKRFARKYCGPRVEVKETIKKGLFGLGKKVEERVTRWRVRVKKSYADDHTGMLGENLLGASLELSRSPITIIRVSIPKSNVFRVELQVEKDMGGMLKHQATGLHTLWKQDVAADPDSLHDALQVLRSQPYLASQDGRLVYVEQ